MAEEKTIWSVGGGKGGIGKSVTSANLGCALAQMGKEVILVDADLGGANLHTYFGIKYPTKGLDDFLKGRVSTLEETAIETQVEGLRLISGAGEFLGIANPNYAQKQKLISHIKNLSAAFIIVDLGAGSTYNILDFFSISNEGIVVIVPEPAAIQNAYIFLKSFVYRRLARLFSDNIVITSIIAEATDARSNNPVKTFSDLCERISTVDRASAEDAVAEVKKYRPKLLLNMAASVDDVKVADAFKAAAKTFLSLDTEFIGTIYSRASVKAAARKMRPYMLEESAVDARKDMLDVVARLLGGQKEEKPRARAEDAAQEVFGFNDNVSHQGNILHVQTEVQGGNEPAIETIIYHGGRIFFSKRTLWSEAAGKNGNQSLKDFASRQHMTAIAAIKMNKITLQG